MWTVTRVTARQGGLTARITHITQAATPEIKQTHSNEQSGPDPGLTIHSTGGKSVITCKTDQFQTFRAALRINKTSEMTTNVIYDNSLFFIIIEHVYE